MTSDIRLDDDFARDLLGRVPADVQFKPTAFYNADGDCIEVMLSNDGFVGHRIFPEFTLFVGRGNEKPVGFLVKGVKQFIKEAKEDFPGFKVEFSHGRIKIEYLLTAMIWKGCDENQSLDVLVNMRQAAREHDLEAQFELA